MTERLQRDHRGCEKRDWMGRDGLKQDERRENSKKESIGEEK
jgi:hypothetical protein